MNRKSLDNLNLRNAVIITLSTFFFIGYLPFIPGTFGSLASILLFYFIKDNVIIFALCTSTLIIIGLWIAGEAEKIFDKKDSKYIVIDEASGMLISLIGVPYDIKLVIIAFILFRILDTLKPYPAGKSQGLKGGLGVMSDDIIAGLYTNIIIQLALRLASFKTS
jgi:phosphatidylglycerophosphatase A